MSLTYNQLISTFVATILIICYWTLGHVTQLPLASFVLVASIHISQKNDTLGMFAPFSFGIKCNTSLVLNKRNLPKKVPLTKERLSNLPLFCIWVTYSLWYWESLKVSRAERGGRGKKIQHCITAPLSTQLSEDAEAFLYLGSMFFLLIEIFTIERTRWCTPIRLY